MGGEVGVGGRVGGWAGRCVHSPCWPLGKAVPALGGTLCSALADLPMALTGVAPWRWQSPQALSTGWSCTLNNGLGWGWLHFLSDFFVGKIRKRCHGVLWWEVNRTLKSQWERGGHLHLCLGPCPPVLQAAPPVMLWR